MMMMRWITTGTKLLVRIKHCMIAYHSILAEMPNKKLAEMPNKIGRDANQNWQRCQSKIGRDAKQNWQRCQSKNLAEMPTPNITASIVASLRAL